jgi:Rrf2 family protein
MKLSTKAHYGLRSCYLLALNFPDNKMSATALEKKINVSSKYIEKIMRILSNRNIITANRGASGGYYLARKPSDITVGEIVRALEDDFELAPCINSPCKKCATSVVWKKLYDGINNVLDGITLQNMVDDFCKTENIKSDNERCFKDKN